MLRSFLQAAKSLLCLAVLILFSGAVLFAQSGSVNLNGSGTLSYIVDSSGYQPCDTGSTEIIPGYQQWTYSGFVYTDGSGVSHSLSGSATYSQVSGSDPSCPPDGGSAIVLNGSNFFINVQPQGDSLAASLNVLLYPKYYVLSILYAPPGNQSSNGFTNTVTNTATTSISHSFASAIATAINVSAAGNGFGVNFSTAKSTQNSQSFQVSTSNGAGATLSSVRNPVDHSQDQFLIWLNPAVVVTPTSSTTANYALLTPIGSNGQPEPMDIVNINAVDLQNPSSIPLAVLASQTRNNVSGLPGLANVCANPAPQCTSAPCGCTTNDFTGILAADPLLSVSLQNTLPDQVDSNRYIFVESQVLEGPECSGCDPLRNSFTANDGQTASQTETTQYSYSVGFTRSSGFSLFGSGLTITNSNTFTWSDAMSTGTSNGTNHTAAVTLGTSDVGCFETINIYEDTVYHTFAFAPPVASSGCN
jgi:hypothetical protein